MHMCFVWLATQAVLLGQVLFQMNALGYVFSLFHTVSTSGDLDIDRTVVPHWHAFLFLFCIVTVVLIQQIFV